LPSVPILRTALPLALLAIAFGGCGGGGGGGGGGSSDSPKAGVEGFVAAAGKGDWKAACDRLGPAGQVSLMTELVVLKHDLVGQAEQDKFGLFKDCPSTLGRHAAGVRALISGAAPGVVQQKPGAKQATVSSPNGTWAVQLEDGPGPPTQWRVAGFPRG
jgi:hypothetical protein